MLAAYVEKTSADAPLDALIVGDRPAPEPREGWVEVTVRSAALNHHDLWSLKGVGLPDDKLPMVLGCDAAGVTDDGQEVLVHAVISDPAFKGDETLDPRRTLLSELHDGTLAERVLVPARNVIPKPAELSFDEACCLPTAWLTAYRMLFTRAQLAPGQTVLVQGAGGGVATAAIALGRAAGLRVWATSRDEAKRALAVELGADEAFDSGARLPGKVDAVMETVGEATWKHSLRSLRPGGTIVVSGATSGQMPPAELNRVFFLQLSVVGSTMGTRDELQQLVSLCATTGLRPRIDRTIALADTREGIEAIASGDLVGKIVVHP